MNRHVDSGELARVRAWHKARIHNLMESCYPTSLLPESLTVTEAYAYLENRPNEPRFQANVLLQGYPVDEHFRIVLHQAKIHRKLKDQIKEQTDRIQGLENANKQLERQIRSRNDELVYLDERIAEMEEESKRTREALGVAEKKAARILRIAVGKEGGGEREGFARR